MLWKYGTAPILTQKLMQSTVGSFLKMYEEPSFPFMDLSQIAYDLGLTEATALTGAQYLVENGIDTGEGSFARDIIQASTRVNYAQNVDRIHGLVLNIEDPAMAADISQVGSYGVHGYRRGYAGTRRELANLRRHAEGLRCKRPPQHQRILNPAPTKQYLHPRSLVLIRSYLAE